jgi:hypothetical protein
MSAVSLLALGSYRNPQLNLCLCVLIAASHVQAAETAVVSATLLTTQEIKTGAPDFTRICWNGEGEGQAGCAGALVANTGTNPGPRASVDWACTRDNGRKLVWSLQSVSAKAEAVFAPGFAQAGHDTTARCGFGSGWRFPTRKELAAIVVPGRTPGPMQQSPYFPRTVDELYWSSDTLLTDPGYAWGIMYGYNGSVGYYRTLPTHLRLVHDAQ